MGGQIFSQRYTGGFPPRLNIGISWEALKNTDAGIFSFKCSNLGYIAWPSGLLLVKATQVVASGLTMLRVRKHRVTW